MNNTNFTKVIDFNKSFGIFVSNIGLPNIFITNKLNITDIKSTFGYIGFLPFAVFSLIPWVAGGEISKTLIVFQLGYGAIILTFLGGLGF